MNSVVDDNALLALRAASPSANWWERVRPSSMPADPGLLYEFQAAYRAISRVEGWLTESESIPLYNAASAAANPIIEIGSWCGRSTLLLGLASMSHNRVPVYAIDPHMGVLTCTPNVSFGQTVDKFLANTAPVSDIVHLLRGFSEDPDIVASAPAVTDLVFFDGKHTVGQIRQELVLYWRKVVLGGTVCFHDVYRGSFPAYTNYCDRLIGSPSFCGWCLNDSLLSARKASEELHLPVHRFVSGGPSWYEHRYGAER